MSDAVSACENCHKGLPLEASTRQRYCDRVCRQTAYRRRQGMKPRGRWHPRRQALAVLHAVIEDEGAALSAMGYNIGLIREWLSAQDHSGEPDR